MSRLQRRPRRDHADLVLSEPDGIILRLKATAAWAFSGIGRELAHLLAKDGDDLFFAADQGPMDEVVARMRTHGGNLESLQVDVATADGVAQW